MSERPGRRRGAAGRCRRPSSPSRSGDEPPFLRPEAPHAGAARRAAGWRGAGRRGAPARRRRSRSPSRPLWAGYAQVMASERLKVGARRGARQPLPLRGRGARAARPRGGREHPGPRHRGPEGPPARLALGGGRHRAPHAARHAAGRDPRARARWRWPRSTASTSWTGRATLIELYGPRTAGFDLPIVRGLAGIEGDARRDRAQRAGALLKDLGDLATEVSEVQFEESGDLRVGLGAPERSCGWATLRTGRSS